MDSLWTLLVFAAIAGISALLKKRRRPEDSDSWPEEPPPRQEGGGGSRPVPKASNWEDEMRRLLEGEEPAKPPPVPPVYPPAVRRPVPPARPPARAVPVSRPRPLKVSEPVEAPQAAGSLLEAAAQAYERGSHLDERLQQHLQEARRQEKAKAAVRRPVSRDVKEAIGLVRNRDSIRSAIIASVILGPAKAAKGG